MRNPTDEFPIFPTSTSVSQASEMQRKVSIRIGVLHNREDTELFSYMNFATPTPTDPLQTAIDEVFGQSMKVNVKRAAEDSLVEGRIGIHRGGVPVIKQTGVPVAGILGMVSCSKAFKAVEEELSSLVDADDLHAALTFTEELLTPRLS